MLMLMLEARAVLVHAAATDDRVDDGDRLHLRAYHRHTEHYRDGDQRQARDRESS